MKCGVFVRKYYESEIPVEAQDKETARNIIGDLLSKGDTDFMFVGTEKKDFHIQYIHEISVQEFKNLEYIHASVNSDGTHEERCTRKDLIADQFELVGNRLRAVTCVCSTGQKKTGTSYHSAVFQYLLEEIATIRNELLDLKKDVINYE